jgi:hypothetical protein
MTHYPAFRVAWCGSLSGRQRRQCRLNSPLATFLAAGREWSTHHLRNDPDRSVRFGWAVWLQVGRLDRSRLNGRGVGLSIWYSAFMPRHRTTEQQARPPKPINVEPAPAIEHEPPKIEPAPIASGAAAPQEADLVADVLKLKKTFESRREFAIAELLRRRTDLERIFRSERNSQRGIRTGRRTVEGIRPRTGGGIPRPNPGFQGQALPQEKGTRRKVLPDLRYHSQSRRQSAQIPEKEEALHCGGTGGSRSVTVHCGLVYEVILNAQRQRKP